MVNTNYNSTEDMIDKLQQLKFYKNIRNYYDNMNIRFDEDPFAKDAQGISKIYHELLKLMTFLQTKRQVKNRKINYYDLYYTVIKVRDENKDIDSQYENDENDYISLNDVIIPNHYVGIKK